MCENIQNCCRICLDVESDHIPIVSNITINLHLKSCLAMNISATDGLPKTICVSCASQLSEFYNFQLNARCSQDWLESSIQEITKKSTETKVAIQPLPDSEYNSDSLLEFLNNTANIEEYLNNLGKEDIPSIVSMLDRNQENSTDSFSKPNNKTTKVLSPKKRDTTKVKHKVNMEIDVLDSDIDIVKEILMKETEPKKTPKKPLQHLSLSDLKQTTKQKMLIHSLTQKSLKNSDPQAEKLKTAKEKSAFTCFACKSKYDQLEKLSQHLSVCDSALRTCIHCNLSFDSKLKMRQHSLIHSKSPVTCLCGKQFNSKDKYTQHHETCIKEPGMTGCMYRCKQCGETFAERFELYKHAKEHVIIASERICDICGHGFIGNEALVKHRHDTHGKSDDLMYRCKVCAHTSPNHREMYLHVKTHLEKEITRHLCESCGRSFSSHASLTRHSLQHKTSEQCHICKKMFKHVELRDKHVLEHTEMVFCEKCGQNVNKFQEHSCM